MDLADPEVDDVPAEGDRSGYAGKLVVTNVVCRPIAEEISLPPAPNSTGGRESTCMGKAGMDLGYFTTDEDVPGGGRRFVVSDVLRIPVSSLPGSA